MQPPALFTPYCLRDLRLRNRIMISPMAQYSAKKGIASDWHLVHLGKFAIGGAGLIFVEATAIEERGATSPLDIGLWNDEQIEPLKRIVRFVKAHGAAAGIQLAHAGRKANQPPPWQGPADCVSPERYGHPIAPSPIGLTPQTTVPKEMTTQDIAMVRDAWVAAARRALEAGFDVIEIHGAHGYLIHEFLSRQTNHRTDAYGGSLKSRMRFPLEIATAVREVWPADRPLFFRFSTTDPRDPDWSLADSIEVARRMKEKGVDVIDCSAGGITKRATISLRRRPQGFLVHIAKSIKQQVGISTAAVGLITEPEFANHIIEQSTADLIAIGREALFNPHWALHAALSLSPQNGFKQWPDQYGWWLMKRWESQNGPEMLN